VHGPFGHSFFTGHTANAINKIAAAPISETFKYFTKRSPIALMHPATPVEFARPGMLIESIAFGLDCHLPSETA
jgi:hypothetical protein